MNPSQILMAFVGGGALCLLAQILIDLTKLTPARIMVSFVCLGVLLYALNLSTPLFNIFGAGVSVPLIGFGIAIADGVKTAVDGTGLIGILTGGLTATSAGITLAILLGFILSLLFGGKSKEMDYK